MTTITSFTTENIKALHAKLDAALKEFAEEQGIIAGSTTVRYSETGMSVKVDFSTRDSNPAGIDPRWLKDLKARGWNHGLTEAMLNVEVEIPAREGQVTKLRFRGMRASKIVMQNLDDGKNYTYNAESMAPVIIRASAI